MNKNNFLIGILGIALSVSSCKKDLDITNTNQPTPGSASTEVGVISLGQGGVYRNGFYDLKYSLDEIGAAEISSKLAQSINNEASLDLKHFFFEPFIVQPKSKKDSDYEYDESGVKLTEHLKSLSLKSSDRALRFLLKNRIEYLISVCLLLVSILVCLVIVRRYCARKRKINHQL
jgi:hypothetical protein